MNPAQETDSLGRTVEFWFDFSSPYAYFAAHEIDKRLERLGRTVIWRPFLLGAVFRLTGMAPLVAMPMRGDYARRDWSRIAQILAVPFQLPDTHPYPSQMVARTYYWLADHASESAKPFALAAFAEHFVNQKTPVTSGAVTALAGRFINDTKPLAAWLGSPQAKDVLRAKTQEAVDKGVFGSPFFIADGEPFWGWDRIPMLEEWLQRGRWS
jgi:2-hydroxychromene-2-carboxylate isomerase